MISAINQEVQRAGIYGLLIEVVGTEPHGAHSIFLVAMAGDNDDLGVRQQSQGLLQGQEAFVDTLSIGREPKILEDNGRLVPTHLCQGTLPILGNEHFVIIETPSQLALQPRIVLNDEQLSALISQQPVPSLGGRMIAHEEPASRHGDRICGVVNR